MYYDAMGYPHESWPGELSGRSYPNRKQNQAPQQQPEQQPAQKQGMLSQSIDVIFVDSREDVERINVNPGRDQVFAAKDDSFFAVKSAVGNTSETVFYRREDPQPSPRAVDMSAFVKREEVPELFAKVIQEMRKQQEET